MIDRRKLQTRIRKRLARCKAELPVGQIQTS